jgi:hypothetical protein
MTLSSIGGQMGENKQIGHMKAKKTNIMNNKKAIKQLTRNYKSTGTQKQAILKTLTAGTEFSVSDARKAGISNPTAVIAKLRNEGFAIYSNPCDTKSGTVNRYALD